MAFLHLNYGFDAIDEINQEKNQGMLKDISFLQKTALVLFGLCLGILILETGLRLGSFVILSIQEQRNLQSIKQKGSFRIMCLGESTTQNQYPPYLEEILNQNNPGIKFSVIDKGVAGIRTTEILSRLEAELDRYQPNMVVAMMGTNDHGGHLPYEAENPSRLTLALKSFKVYKLIRLLGLHLAIKLDEARNYVSLNSGQAARALSSRVSGIPASAGEINSANGFAYRQTGYFYCDQAGSAELEQLCKKAIELQPDDDSRYIQLGWFYADRFRYAEAEQLFKQAAKIKPDHDSAYIELGRVYQKQGKPAEAEQAFKKALALNPNNFSALGELGSLYSQQGRFPEAEQLFKRCLELEPDSEQAQGRLALVYSEIGNAELFKVYTENSNRLKSKFYKLQTVNSYRSLKQILDGRKIRLVCVQYPLQNIEPLKKIFEKEIRDSIIFVDNEEVFKDAVSKEGYREYFTDTFGGNFGHCTSKGNRLLASNIANTILKEAFAKID